MGLWTMDVLGLSFGGNLIELLYTITDRGMCKHFKVANSIFIITLVNQSHSQGCMSPLWPDDGA